MDFELTDDQLELQRTVRDVLAQECPPDLVRAVTEGGAADELWDTLVSLDWPGLALATEHGGTGYSWVELAIVLEELGRAVAPGPLPGHRDPVRPSGVGQWPRPTRPPTGCRWWRRVLSRERSPWTKGPAPGCSTR